MNKNEILKDFSVLKVTNKKKLWLILEEPYTNSAGNGLLLRSRCELTVGG